MTSELIYVERGEVDLVDSFGYMIHDTAAGLSVVLYNYINGRG